MSLAPVQPVLDAIVQRLAAAYAPQRVILFGSHADGDPDHDSDIDLLIIKATDERFDARTTTVRRLLLGTHPRVPLDLLVITPEELRLRLAGGDQFLAGVLAQGRTLYAA